MQSPHVLQNGEFVYHCLEELAEEKLSVEGRDLKHAHLWRTTKPALLQIYVHYIWAFQRHISTNT